jgi:hypothetical protein
LGVLIGLTVSQQKSKPGTVSKVNKQNELSTPAGGQEEDQPDNIAGEPVQINNTKDIESNTAIISTKEEASVSLQKKNSEPDGSEKENIIENNAQKTANNPKENQPASQTSEEKTEAKAEVVDIMEMVSVKANDYKRGAFGGIKNLQLTVTNESQYLLDKVKVELQYLKPSEQALITETVEFTSVAPKGTMTIRIPDNSRGIKVLCRVISVKSSQYENVMAGL